MITPYLYDHGMGSLYIMMAPYLYDHGMGSLYVMMTPYLYDHGMGSLSCFIYITKFNHILYNNAPATVDPLSDKGVIDHPADSNMNINFSNVSFLILKWY